MVRLFGQHETAGPRQRIESRLGQTRELVLAVAIGKVREHEVGKPIRGPLIECAQDARVVSVSRAALEQALGLLAPVAPEVSVQQINHRPQMAPFFHVHLKKIAEIVKRRRGLTQMALLLHRCRLGIALGHDQPAEYSSMLARNFAPDWFALMLTEWNAAIGFRFREKNAPSVIRHLHPSKSRPPFRG